MIFNILDNTTELWMTKYIIGEIFSSGRVTLYKNPSDQTVFLIVLLIFLIFRALCILLLLFQVATPNMRGSLAVIPAVAGTLGLLTTQVLGAYLNWQWLSIVCAGLNVPFLLMLIFIPESPVYLISTEQIERAHKILRVLRGNLLT